MTAWHAICVWVTVYWAHKTHPIISKIFTGLDDPDDKLSEQYDALGFDLTFESWESDDN